MAYTNIYDKIMREPEKITWGDLFSDSLKKHNKADIDYALIAGTSIDSATEANMFQKWKKPWLFRMFLSGGVMLSLLVCLVVYAYMQLAGVSDIVALNLLFIVVPPLIVPLTLMIFFWELNIPRNISLYQLLGYFMVGGMLSMLASLFLGEITSHASPLTAPFTEEPGKLIAVMLLIKLFCANKNRKLYGITGLVIGAAVGAGFGAFESAQYAYNTIDWAWLDGFIIHNEEFFNIIKNELIRGIFAVCGHTLFCAPYAAAVALNMNGGKITTASLANREFKVTFVCSVAAHFIGNTYSSSFMLLILKRILTTIILWQSTLYVLRKCMKQLAALTVSNPKTDLLPGIKLTGVSGCFASRVFGLKNTEVFMGTDSSCNLCFPIGTAGVSEKHCELLIRNGYLYLADLGSVHGTWLNGKKLPPKKGYLLKTGDTFYLGTQSQTFKIT